MVERTENLDHLWSLTYLPSLTSSVDEVHKVPTQGDAVGAQGRRYKYVKYVRGDLMEVAGSRIVKNSFE